MKVWRDVDAQRCERRASRPASLILAAGFAAVIALGLAACGPMPTGGNPSAANPSTPSSAGPATQSPSVSPAPTPSPSPRPSLIPPAGAADVDASTPDGPIEAAPLPTTEAAITDPVAFNTGMVIELVAVEAIGVTAETPGEVDGTAVRVTVSAHNNSTEPQSVDSALVTVVAADQIGIGTTAGGPSPLTGEVAPGATASGTYVFMLDPAADREITVSVNYAAGEPVAVFTGTTS